MENYEWIEKNVRKKFRKEIRNFIQQKREIERNLKNDFTIFFR